MQKTIMIIGGGLLQIPLIHTAKKMGYQTVVTDYNENAIGMKEADVPIVMSTKDIEGSVRIAKSQNELTPISAVLTVGTDASMTVAAVANALKLPGIKFDDAEAATNKIKMRTRFKEHNIPSPKFFPIWSLADAKKACKELGFPVIIKPSDNMGARGVSRVNNLNELKEAFDYAKTSSPSGELILEEMMDGPELSIDAIIFNNEITYTGIADRIITYPPYFVEIGHNMPSALPEQTIIDACSVMSKGIKALGINIGAAKGDIKITPKGPMIGELAARLSGGFMSTHTYPLSSGIDLMRAVIETALGQEPSNLEPLYNKVSIERSIISKPGYVRKISGLEEALKVKGIKEIFIDVKVGDKIESPRSNVEKSGHIIAVANSLKEAEDAVQECLTLIEIETIEKPSLSLDLINSYAREKFKKICYVCKICDGYDCATGVPGMGGIGTGTSFKQNTESLKRIKIITSLVHDINEPDTTSSFLGHEISFPVMAAPITGSVTNLGGVIDELDYNIAVLKGCSEAGTIAFIGDGATPEKYKIGLAAIKETGGKAIAIFKPRYNNEEIITRIKAAEDAGAIGVGVDIDAVVFKTMEMRNQSVGPKGVKSLAQLISSSNLPFVVKGIMNKDDAIKSIEAGAKAIIVSNHGGRVLDDMPGTMDVLHEIVEAINNKILIMIDGGFRKGVDIIKANALGAKLVLIGRPITIAAVGMGAQGVSFYLDTIKQDLKKSMILTGCAKMDDISSKIIKIIN